MRAERLATRLVDRSSPESDARLDVETRSLLPRKQTNSPESDDEDTRRLIRRRTRSRWELVTRLRFSDPRKHTSTRLGGVHRPLRPSDRQAWHTVHSN